MPGSDNPSMLPRIFLLAVMAALTGCSPTLDWREVRPDGAGVEGLFPCKPSTDVRTVALDGARVRMTLLSCAAGDVTWALMFADVADPARVASGLAALRAASASNLGGTPQVLGALEVVGMTPNASAERVRIQGVIPDGRQMTLETGFFVRGTHVFQASVMGSTVPGDGAATFFEGFKLRPR